MIDFGPVKIIRGKYRGQRGFYDDDGETGAIVYIGNPGDGFVEIPYTNIEPLPEGETYDGNDIVKDAAACATREREKV